MSIINIGILKQFLENQYARHLIFKTDNLEILLVCWLPGQKAEIHDHGQSDAVTLILEGRMAYTTFYQDGSKVSGTLHAGDIEHIPAGVKHQVTNNTSEKLVTLHIYSPPLESELLSTSLGYANKFKIQEVQSLEKTVRYLMAEKPAREFSYSNSATNVLESKNLGTISSDNRPKQKTVAIIGGGFSGTLVATQLMQSYSSTPLQIILIERTTRFAKGLAYSTTSPLHLLNVEAGKISAFPDNPNHFLNWLQNRNPDMKSDSFVPRMLYGEYLETVLYEAEINKSSQVSFVRLHDEVTSVKLLEDDLGAVINLSNGVQLPVSFIVLAVGNYTPRNPAMDKNSFYKSKRYVRDPWSVNSLSMISSSDPILLIGTGLTMVDKAIELRCRGHRGTIFAISRHGLLPQAHNLQAKPLNFDFNLEPPITIKNLLEVIRKKVKSEKENEGEWHSVIDSLRPHIQGIWSSMPLEEKCRFFNHVRPYWEVHRHRIPPQIATIINSMLESKQLQIYKGRIKNYEETENHVNVTIQERSSTKLKSLQVTRVINCSGSETNFCCIEDPLIINLLEQGLIIPDKLSLGLEAASNGALKDINGNTSKVLYTLGPPLKGQLWETTAVPEIREQAYSLAKEIIEKIEKDFLLNELSYAI